MQIDSHQASIYHFALGAACDVIADQIKLKSAAPFVEALAIQLSAYRAEQAKLEAQFPKLKPEQKPE